jgi:hypothetical protein
MLFSRIWASGIKKGSCSLRDDSLDAGGRALQGAIAGKVRMRG